MLRFWSVRPQGISKLRCEARAGEIRRVCDGVGVGGWVAVIGSAGVILSLGIGVVWWAGGEDGGVSMSIAVIYFYSGRSGEVFLV